ncbi:MAG: outer membrane protein assembly factor BamD, partial [Deltaproteobacteria bacterium]|nr:outer membrane protein assembly factor BamD [Deltaproteobacteria bacterium]
MKKIILALAAITISFCGACGHSPEEISAPSPPPSEELYLEAMNFYKRKNYIDGFDAFQKCRTRYPISEWGIKAELKMANCLYYQKQYESAFIQYREFTRLHPTYRFIDYAYYQMGMCYYKQLLTIDRDQTFPHEAVKQFERLISRFPSSPYGPSAQAKIRECKENIAERIIYIGNFYYRTGAYNAALHRFLEALNDYHDYLSSPDLLFFQLGKIYLRFNEPENAREQFIALIREYPESPFVPLSETLLEDPNKIEEIDKIKISEILNKINPVRAIGSIPIPFIGERE